MLITVCGNKWNRSKYLRACTSPAPAKSSCCQEGTEPQLSMAWGGMCPGLSPGCWGHCNGSGITTAPELHIPALPKGCSCSVWGWAGLMAQCPQLLWSLTQHVFSATLSALVFPCAEEGMGEQACELSCCQGRSGGMVRATPGRLQGQQGTAGLSMASGFHKPACGHGYTLCSKLHPYPRHRGTASGSGQGRDFP